MLIKVLIGTSLVINIRRTNSFTLNKHNREGKYICSFIVFSLAVTLSNVVNACAKQRITGISKYMIFYTCRVIYKLVVPRNIELYGYMSKH